MTEEDISKWAKKLIQRFDNMKIVGGGGEWSGNARQGFAFNPRPKSAAEVTPIGACCIGTDCTITTEADCVASGGIYQGNGTTCTPNPCLPTGACCLDGDCSITTESECTGMGGTYQGDGTDCDPNPCPPPCTFDNLPTHVTGTVDFSGVFCCDDGTQCTITAHYDVDDALVVSFGERRFLGLGVGTATYDCGSPSTCSEPAHLEVEIYLRCSTEIPGNYEIHLFTETTGVSCCVTASFAYNDAIYTQYTPPVISVVFPLDEVTSNCCSGGCTGSMVLTLT